MLYSRKNFLTTEKVSDISKTKKEGNYSQDGFTLLQALVDRHYIAIVTKNNKVLKNYQVKMLCSAQLTVQYIISYYNTIY